MHEGGRGRHRGARAAGGLDPPNPEIRDDSHLNNVGGMNSEQPREEANSAEGPPT